MKPVDKFGMEIYPYLFKKLERIGKSLEDIGYVESKQKSNLFSYRITEGCFYADMRGTHDCLIWHDPRPFCYFFPNGHITIKEFQINRLHLSEEKRLKCHNIPFRAGYGYLTNVECGFCHVCGNDFNDDGKFCSNKCARESEYKSLIRYAEQNSEKSSRIVCSKCERNPVFDLDSVEGFIKHHIDYENDITKLVCRQCHNKIHKGDDGKFKSYKPVDWEEKVALKRYEKCRIKEEKRLEKKVKKESKRIMLAKPQDIRLYKFNPFWTSGY